MHGLSTIYATKLFTSHNRLSCDQWPLHPSQGVTKYLILGITKHPAAHKIMCKSTLQDCLVLAVIAEPFGYTSPRHDVNRLAKLTM